MFLEGALFGTANIWKDCQRFSLLVPNYTVGNLEISRKIDIKKSIRSIFLVFIFFTRFPCIFNTQSTNKV